MPTRHAQAVWEGGLKDGRGRVKPGNLEELRYSFTSRFESGPGTNPEELLGAAHAGCFSMALAAALEKAGHPPRRVATRATVHLEKAGEAFAITRIELATDAQVPGLDDATFQKQAAGAKQNCPVSKALAGVKIELEAKLVK